MSFKDAMQARLRSSRNAPFMLFITRFDQRDQTHYVFCEAREDILFYELMAHRLSLNRVPLHFIPCNGKSQLFATRSRIKNGNYDGKRLSYIVDADHDRYVGGSVDWSGDVFVTDHYSVESYLILPTIFVECLRQHTGLQKDDPIVREASDTFIASLSEFARAMTKPMAAAIAMRRCCGPDSLHFDRVELHKFVRLPNVQEVEVLAPLDEHILGLVPVDKVDACRSLLADVEKKLLRYDPRNWIRGKFLSWWFSQIFNLIAKWLSGKCVDQHGVTISCGLTMGHRNFVALVAHHGDPPRRFSLFMQRRLSGQVAE